MAFSGRRERGLISTTTATCDALYTYVARSTDALFRYFFVFSSFVAAVVVIAACAAAG